jgi:hypothetical protein
MGGLSNIFNPKEPDIIKPPAEEETDEQIKEDLRKERAARQAFSSSINANNNEAGEPTTGVNL